ncbi:complement C1q-like protein 4 [Mercenaria mercenaria]|uniref:complement C1q-like protein 4 n=1 Tax=Mercenaria mercenaria TaxID=6596 RepID=UPI001E1D8F3D|nr:complement C1q-like protein 4 [Mercenaria mercenaria]
MFPLQFICLLLLGIRCHAFLLDDDSLSNLLQLLQREKVARGLLETEIVNLRADIAQVNRRHHSSQCQCPVSKAVAFSATLTHDITNLGVSQPIIYDKVITNVGGAYDARHGSFRAPVSGTYKFSFSVLQGTSAMYIAVELVRNGSPIGRVRTGDYGYYAVGTNIVNVHLDAEDDVWVQHQDNLGSRIVKANGGGFSLFTGHLVKAD